VLQSQEFLEVHTSGDKSSQSQDHTSFQLIFAPESHQAPASNTIVSVHIQDKTPGEGNEHELLGHWLGLKALNVI
jgi:hypothetical protein